MCDHENVNRTWNFLVTLMGLLVTWYKFHHTGWQKNVVDSNTKEFQPVKLDFPLFSMTQWRMPRFLLGPLFVFCKKICERELSHVLTSKIKESQSNNIGHMSVLLGPPERLPNIAELSKLVHCTSNVLAGCMELQCECMVWSTPRHKVQP